MNIRLGSFVAEEACRLWPTIRTKWDQAELDVLSVHACRIPIDEGQVCVALANLKAELKTFPTVPHFLEALRKAAGKKADPTKPARWHNCSPEGIARLRAKFPEYAAMPPHQVVAEQYAGFPMRTFSSVNHFRRSLAEDLAFHECPPGEVFRWVECAREEAEKSLVTPRTATA